MEQYKEKLRSALQGCTTPQEIHNALGNAAGDVRPVPKSKNSRKSPHTILLIVSSIFLHLLLNSISVL